MSTSKNIDKICALIMAFSVLLTLLFSNGEALGIQVAAKTMGYEQRLFDTSKVHTIAIVMDDWEGFLETCENEEYSACSVVIDGESYKNVALRAKGNTSLSSVKNMDSSRYSFKIEFDHYEKGKTYHGLDKLCLNNIIQDNTFMKDYLAYHLMDGFGVDSSLCSFAYITVNGEDWGLYLAVEAVEDSFLQRTKEGEGNLYKPDTTQNGGGRGNGREFDADDFMDRMEEYGFDFGRKKDSSETETGTETQETQGPEGNVEAQERQTSGEGAAIEGESGEAIQPPVEEGESGEATQAPTIEAGAEESTGEPAEGAREWTQDMSAAMEGELPAFMEGATPFEGMEEGEFPMPSDFPEGAGMPGGAAMGQGGPNGSGGNGGGFGGMGSSATKLQYIDDNVESYEEIFSSAKTEYSQSDANALIRSLKSITKAANELEEEQEKESVQEVKEEQVDEASLEATGEEDPEAMPAEEESKPSQEAEAKEAETDPEAEEETEVDWTDTIPLSEAVDMDQVLRYFVVHNFLCNGDSYTGAMIHNYYLHEGTQGELSMIPWDYNLAFGGFQATDATSTVNSSIDEPLSGTLQDRPMMGWIFSEEEYADAYHSLFSEFMKEYYESGKLFSMISDTAELIAPYVEKDPTKFCTYEEFETGVEAIQLFCSLRCEAVEKQLSGDDTQVDASALTLSDMGSMNQGGGGPGGGGRDGSGGHQMGGGSHQGHGGPGMGSQMDQAGPGTEMKPEASSEATTEAASEAPGEATSEATGEASLEATGETTSESSLEQATELAAEEIEEN